MFPSVELSSLQFLYPFRSVCMSQNLRFHFEECGSGVNPAGEKITPSLEQVKAFKLALSKLGDVYVFEVRAWTEWLLYSLGPLVENRMEHR